MMQEKYRQALLKACRLMGGQKQLAERININPSRLNKWINRNKGTVPFQCALDIESATSGQVTCDELVPRWEKVVAHCSRNKEEINYARCTSHVNSLTIQGSSENSNISELAQNQQDIENNLID